MKKFFVFLGGVLIAGIVVVGALSIGLKTDDPGRGDANTLTSSEFNELVGVLKGIKNAGGLFGIGGEPETGIKLHVDGNVKATSFETCSGDCPSVVANTAGRFLGEGSGIWQSEGDGDISSGDDDVLIGTDKDDGDEDTVLEVDGQIVAEDPTEDDQVATVGYVEDVLNGMCLAAEIEAPFGSCGDDIVMDDGTRYSTVTVGSQCWMHNNLDVGGDNTLLTATEREYCVQKYCFGDPDECRPGDGGNRGGYYTWDEAIAGICPDGWHLPSREEFVALVEHAVPGGYDSNHNRNYAEMLRDVGFSLGIPSAGFVGSNFTDYAEIPIDGEYSYTSGHSMWWTSHENSDGVLVFDFDFNRSFEGYGDKNYGEHAEGERDDMAANLDGGFGGGFFRRVNSADNDRSIAASIRCIWDQEADGGVNVGPMRFDEGYPMVVDAGDGIGARLRFRVNKTADIYYVIAYDGFVGFGVSRLDKDDLLDRYMEGHPFDERMGTAPYEFLAIKSGKVENIPAFVEPRGVYIDNLLGGRGPYVLRVRAVSILNEEDVSQEVIISFRIKGSFP